MFKDEEGIFIISTVSFPLICFIGYGAIIFYCIRHDNASPTRLWAITHMMGSLGILALGMCSSLKMLWKGECDADFYTSMQAVTVAQVIIVIYDNICYCIPFESATKMEGLGLYAAMESLVYVVLLGVDGPNKIAAGLMVGFVVGWWSEIILAFIKLRQNGKYEAIIGIWYGWFIRLVYIIQFQSAKERWLEGLIVSTAFSNMMVGLSAFFFLVKILLPLSHPLFVNRQ